MKNKKATGNLKRLIIIFVILLLAKTGMAQPENLARLAWMQGTWEGKQGNNFLFEQWSEPAGTMMLGLAQRWKEGKTLDFEYARIAPGKNGILEFIVLPSGQKETSFSLTSLTQNAAVFENPGHDFPQRIEYKLTSPDSLQALLEGEIQGRKTTMLFSYHKKSCP